MARTRTTAADVTAPNEELTDVNRRAAEAAAAATTAAARSGDQPATPADDVTPPSDPAV